MFTSSGAIAITATVTDSRGRQSSTTGYVSVTQYRDPEISSVYAERCTNDNVSSSTGTGGHILIGCGYSAIGNNAISSQVYYRQKGTTAWLGGTYITPSTTAYSLFASEGTFSSSVVYEVRVVITDSLGKTASLIQTLGTAYAFMQWEPQIDAIGFGCYPQGARRVEISEDWDFYVNGEKFEGSNSNIVISTTQPTNPKQGMIWLDIS